MRCIDADALEELFREVIGGIAKKPEMNGNLEHMVRASAMVIEMIQDAPTIEPERKKGRWIDDKGNPVKIADGATNRSCWCSVCGEWLTASDEYNTKGNFCPNCGAEMTDGEG